MTRIWFFIHLFGFTIWIGGALASMFAGIAARGEDRAALGVVARAQANIHRLLVFPGAMLTVLSGLVLTFRITGAYASANTWLIVMQGTGILAALVVMMVGVPTVTRLARIDPTGPHSTAFDDLRSRHAVIASISGVLALISLIAGAMLRYPA